MTNNIVLKNLVKKFGSFTAIDDVSFTVNSDEVMCLLGPSGCGKTTTLRMIAGLENVTSGAVEFSGSEVTHLPASQRNAAMAFQFYALYPSLTVSENLIYPLHAEGLSQEQINQKLQHISKVLQLTHALDRYPQQLSEGEKQRVAVGRCIIRTPQCFLFDEPLSRLDAQLREEMRADIKLVLSELSRPTVIVTHDQVEALTMGDRIVVMNQGKIEQIGTPKEVFDKPNNVFVAGFIGTPQMNLLKGVISRKEDVVIAKFGTDEININPISKKLNEGDLITLGMRPRSAKLVDSPGVGIFSGECELIEPMGAEVLLRISHPTGQLRIIVKDDQEYQTGSLLHVQFDVSSYHLFNSDGLRVED